MALAAITACAEKRPEPTGEIQPVGRIQLDTNRIVEVVGLRHWMADDLQDSLRRYAPGQALDSAGVAAALRYKLHFADAAVHTSVQVFDENETTQITIGVREPRDSARVHYAPQTLDSVQRVAEWKSISSMLTAAENAGRFGAVVGRFLNGRPRDVIDSSVKGRPVTTQMGYAFESARDSVAARPIIDALAKRTTDSDFATAMATIDHSTSEPDRIVAALILANFSARDSAWYTLLKAAVGQRQAQDAAVAWQALDGMSRLHPRDVDWTPVAATIHDVLDGMALAALPAIADALTRTGADPRYAKSFLSGGGEMLTAYSESANPDLSEPTHKLLVALKGSDLGTDPEPWRAWIRTLK